MQKGEQLYEGKAKKVFAVEGRADWVWTEFKNSLTAFNGEKKLDLEGKGRCNAMISSLLFSHLHEKSVKTHYSESISETEFVGLRLEMIPLEVVVRNFLAGSTAKKFAIEEGTQLQEPLVEFYYKKDELGDPFISDEQAIMLKAADQPTMDNLKRQALEINRHLVQLFSAAGIDLIDFKLEFGKDSAGEVILGDEISPDTCRLWDQSTREKMDKDRFRRDLGDVVENYQEVLKRLQTALGKV